MPIHDFIVKIYIVTWIWWTRRLGRWRGANQVSSIFISPASWWRMNTAFSTSSARTPVLVPGRVTSVFKAGMRARWLVGPFAPIASPLNKPCSSTRRGTTIRKLSVQINRRFNFHLRRRWYRFAVSMRCSRFQLRGSDRQILLESKTSAPASNVRASPLACRQDTISPA